MRQFRRPQNEITRLTSDLESLPMIQPWIEEIKIVSVRVPLKPGAQVLINIRQALEASPIAANVG